MKGLPSREWRTTSSAVPVRNYGSTFEKSKHVSLSGRIAWLCSLTVRGMKCVIGILIRGWLIAFGWTKTRSTLPRRILAIMLLLISSLALISLSAATLSTYLTRNDPCVVAKREKIRLFEIEDKGLIYTEQVPQHIHHYGKFNDQFTVVFDNATFKHSVWRDSSVRALLKSDFPDLLPAWEHISPDFKWEYGRFFVLAKIGGIVARHDFFPMLNFWNSIPKDRPAFIENRNNLGSPSMQDILITSPPGHSLWNITFSVIRALDNEGELVAGRGSSEVLEIALRRLRQTQAEEEHSAVQYLPCENFLRNNDLVGSAGPRSYLTLRNTLILNRCGNVNDHRCLFGTTNSYKAET